MSVLHYILTVKMSDKSATAFSLSAHCDEDALGQAAGVLDKVGAFCKRPAFEVARTDGTIVQSSSRSQAPYPIRSN